MKGKKYVNSLIKEKNKTGGIAKGRIKGLSEKELRYLIDNIVEGSAAIKACAYNAMKQNI